MNILMIDNDSPQVDIVRSGFDVYGYPLRHFTDGEQGLQYALSESFDIGIIEIMLPNLNGWSLRHRIKDAGIQVPFILLSAQHMPEGTKRDIQHEGDVFLAKPFSFSELFYRVQVMRNKYENWQYGNSLELSNLQINLESRTVIRDGKEIDLNAYEYSLLVYLVRNANCVVSKLMIRDIVWSYNFDSTHDIIEPCLSRLKNKIDDRFALPMLHRAGGDGITIRNPCG